VLKFMRARGLRYRRFAPARYFEALHALVRSHEPARCVDLLVLGAFIEARSCERFQRLGPRLPEDIATFYRGLCAAESRHYGDYLTLAARRADAAEIEARVAVFRAREAELISAADPLLRFHSGVPG
jgi:tRNA 2-(methylsulfanyl)-N6-isopentenyladenosine37 hydroxylase